MKRCVFLFVPRLLLLTACARPADQSHATVEYSYAEDLTTLEDVLRHSTNIVRAKLVSMDDFDGAVQVYLFHVTNDLTGNTPDEIHVYDAYDPAYILGHSYYLFLCSGESALYPHTIYTTVVKEMILDADAPEAVTAAGSHGMAVPLSDLPRAVADAKTRGSGRIAGDDSLRVADGVNRRVQRANGEDAPNREYEQQRQQGNRVFTHGRSPPRQCRSARG